MDYNSDNNFDLAIRAVCGRLNKYLRLLPRDVKNSTIEIRLRVNQPVGICCVKGLYFLSKNGGVTCRPGPESLIADSADLAESFRSICSYSIYTHQEEIRNGFVTMSGGHRAGVCGTAVAPEGRITAIRDISSIHIRIAREVFGCADELLKGLQGAPEGGLLIAGAPASGKTTLLRDLARQLSSGFWGDIRRVAVVDERGELAGAYLGEPQNDLGICCDVLNGYPKGAGILQAVRALAPEFILCDELGGDDDLAAVAQGLNAGVAMVSTIHAGNLRQLLQRPAALRLLQTGAFAAVALLQPTGPGRLAGIFKAGDLLAQVDGSAASHSGGSARGLCGVA